MDTETPDITSDQSSSDDSEILFTAKINGVEKPVTASQARRYAEQAGGLESKLSELKAYEGELRAWSDFKKGFQEDPHGALTELASAAGGSYKAPGTSSKGAQMSSDEIDQIEDAADSVVSRLEQEIQALKGQLYGFQAQTGLEKEIGMLKAKYTDMTEEHLHQVLSTAGQYNGLPLEAAYRLTRFDELASKLNSPATTPDTDEQPPISRGGSTPAGLLAEKANAADFKKPLKDIMAAAWSESQKKLNVKFN